MPSYQNKRTPACEALSWEPPLLRQQPQARHTSQEDTHIIPRRTRISTHHTNANHLGARHIGNFRTFGVEGLLHHTLCLRVRPQLLPKTWNHLLVQLRDPRPKSRNEIQITFVGTNGFCPRSSTSSLSPTRSAHRMASFHREVVVAPHPTEQPIALSEIV